ELGEELAAASVDHGLLVLRGRPLGMSGHAAVLAPSVSCALGVRRVVRRRCPRPMLGPGPRRTSGPVRLLPPRGGTRWPRAVPAGPPRSYPRRGPARGP